MPEHEAGGPGVERAQGEGLSSSLPGLHRAGCTSESGRMPAVRGHGSGGGPGQAPSQAAGVQWERGLCGGRWKILSFLSNRYSDFK